jgi:L-lactate dehydrogenase
MMRWSLRQLEDFVRALFEAGDLEPEKAACVARLLVRTEAMGRHTHGLAMVPNYLDELARGRMARSGEPDIVADHAAVSVWDGRYLPGLWLVERAIEAAIPRAQAFGLAAVSIRRSHHIGCLAALVKLAADRGFMALIANSDPSGRRVAPYGGKQALFTPNPFAVGYPAGNHPTLIDVCASITTTSMTRQKVAEGALFDHPWLLDANGQPTRDPQVLEHAQPRGSLQLVGGQDHGHKGFGWALMIEALSQGLSGHGRRDAPTQWGGNVYLQVIDPSRFAGLQSFEEQVTSLQDQCRANPPINPARPVRVPGDQADEGLRRAQAEGLQIAQATWAALSDRALALGVGLPHPEVSSR